MELLGPDLELTSQSNSKLVIHGQVSFEPLDDSVLKYHFLHRRWQEVAGADILASPTEYKCVAYCGKSIHHSFMFSLEGRACSFQIKDSRTRYKRV